MESIPIKRGNKRAVQLEFIKYLILAIILVTIFWIVLRRIHGAIFA